MNSVVGDVGVGTAVVSEMAGVWDIGEVVVTNDVVIHSMYAVVVDAFDTEVGAAVVDVVVVVGEADAEDVEMADVKNDE